MFLQNKSLKIILDDHILLRTIKTNNIKMNYCLFSLNNQNKKYN